MGEATTAGGTPNVAVCCGGSRTGTLQPKRPATMSPRGLRKFTCAWVVCVSARLTVAVSSVPPGTVALVMVKDGEPVKQLSPVLVATHPLAHWVWITQLLE